MGHPSGVWHPGVVPLGQATADSMIVTLLLLSHAWRSSQKVPIRPEAPTTSAENSRAMKGDRIDPRWGEELGFGKADTNCNHCSEKRISASFESKRANMVDSLSTVFVRVETAE